MLKGSRRDAGRSLRKDEYAICLSYSDGALSVASLLSAEENSGREDEYDACS